MATFDLNLSIDWSSDETHVLSSPFLKNKKFLLEDQLPELKGHIWLTTSGTTRGSSSCWIALSKEAFLISSESVNKRLEVTSKDRWLNVLPHFHVGGLSVLSRCYLSGCKLVQRNKWAWNTQSFKELIIDERITLCSLVPAQIFDLVKANIFAPLTLRAVIVGGGALSKLLFKKARKLGWPLLPSYGMTECASQVATAELSSLNEDGYPDLKILSHNEVRVDRHQMIGIKSQSLMTGVYQSSPQGSVFNEYSSGQWFWSQDQGALKNLKWLEVFGRKGEMKKILGELVDWSVLYKWFQEISENDPHLELIMTPHDRRGYQVDLVCQGFNFFETASRVKQVFDKGVRPFEAIQNIYYIDQLPQTEMGKIKRKKLLKKIGTETTS